MKPFAWILISFPVYLLFKGKLAGYVALAKSIPSSASGLNLNPGASGTVTQK